jgi:hypothetical protein
MSVRIPGDAVDVTGKDLLAPAQDLLRGLSLLPIAGEQRQADGFTAALQGPPDSVALIEAGATAFSKWWVAGAGASVLGVWGSVAKFYQDQQDGSTQRALLWAAAITSAALILAIAYVINADLRGRAAVQVATVTARAAVARAMLEQSRGGPAGSPAADVIAVQTSKTVTYTGVPAKQEPGWQLLAMTSDGDPDKIKYLIAKGDTKVWAGSADVVF